MSRDIKAEIKQLERKLKDLPRGSAEWHHTYGKLQDLYRPERWSNR